jgi:2-methylisocitrate lyase-like PEP mutase family enzyme
MHGRQQLAASLASPDITVAPGVYDGISTRLVEQMGFETGFLSGAGVSNSRLARPDVGFLNLSEIAGQARQLTSAVDIPIWVDADTGYGNAVNVYHTVRELADAGAAAIMIEDQEWPKRCGHMDGKSVIDFDEAVAKVQAACEARDEFAPELLIKARTDAAGTDSLDEAVRRLQAFADAGADIVFADALLSEADIRRVATDVDGATLSVNMGFGIRSRPTTPLIPAKQLEDMGVDAVIYPRLITAAASMGMKHALGALQEAVETPDEYEEPDLVMDWDSYMDLIGEDETTALERRFATDEAAE